MMNGRNGGVKQPKSPTNLPGVGPIGTKQLEAV